ncbi:MAG: antibiotic biosynthesis monooxygenase [Marivibrio sp.]|uniref:antibiotic biosynthesis monooxygenase n=1 Tax=Marivibrio sp. TaxID=2039719 RepID=UPI0032EE7ACB
MTDEATLIADQPRTLFVALKVRRADAERCAEALSRLNGRLNDVDGFRSFEVIRRDDGGAAEFYILVRFRNEAALARWRESPERRDLLGEVEALAVEEIARRQGTGSSIWFEPIAETSGGPKPPSPPRFWKRWTVSMLAVYPPLVLLVTALQPITGDLPQAAGLFLVALILTGITTAWLIPWLTRRLQGWLAR